MVLRFVLIVAIIAFLFGLLWIVGKRANSDR